MDWKHATDSVSTVVKETVSMDFHDPRHPIWSLMRTLIGLVALVIILWVNAEHFDETELKTILWAFFAFLGAEGISGFFTRGQPK